MKPFIVSVLLVLSTACASTEFPKPVRDARDAGFTTANAKPLPGWSVEVNCDNLEFRPFCMTDVRSDDAQARIRVYVIAPPRGSTLEAAFEHYHFIWPHATLRSKKLDPPQGIRIESFDAPVDWAAELTWIQREGYDEPLEHFCVFRPVRYHAGLSFKSCGTWPPESRNRYYGDFRAIEDSIQLSR